MAHEDFTVTLLFTQSAREVYEAINNVSAWWQGEIKGKSYALNDEFEYRMETFHYSKQRVVELIPHKKVVWLVTDSHLSSFTKNQEWTGTKIVFEITTVKNKTQLHFTHRGLVPKFQCYGDCSGGWTALIKKSLHSLITTGKGKQVF